MGKEILVDERRWRLRDENDFQSVKEWEAFEERVNNMINSGSQIVKLPQELTWSGIKSALQAMYKSHLSNPRLPVPYQTIGLHRDGQRGRFQQTVPVGHRDVH